MWVVDESGRSAIIIGVSRSVTDFAGSFCRANGDIAGLSFELFECAREGELGGSSEGKARKRITRESE
jgi:hypothetical protein